MDLNIQEVTSRIRALREDMEISMQEMAVATERSLAEYAAQESGEHDLSFTFLQKCAERLGVDLVELLTGEGPRLQRYEITRAGDGISIMKANGYEYLQKAPRLKNKLADIFMMHVPYSDEALSQPIHLSFHEGQEIEFVVSGHMRFQYDNNFEELEPGDIIVFDPTHGHGMVAVGGEDLYFLAIVIKDPGALK
ncbi:MAG: cupin domain-containing protein [Coriobacteriales bacterium]|nr:cupin domain-containing protein [Coriobacteriales bacterium]